ATTALYDRGLGVSTVVSGAHLEGAGATAAPVTIAAYDGMGRLVTLTKPDPLLGVPSSRPSVIVEYLLPADASKQPFSIAHARSRPRGWMAYRRRDARSTRCRPTRGTPPTSRRVPTRTPTRARGRTGTAGSSSRRSGRAWPAPSSSARRRRDTRPPASPSS